MPTVKIINGALTITKHGPVILGELDPESFFDIKIDKYQRERQDSRHIDKLKKGFLDDSMACIFLSVRGTNYSQHDTTFLIYDPVHNVNGQQRMIAAKERLVEVRELMKLGNATESELAIPHVWCQVHFREGYKWEAEKFLDMDNQKKISTNIICRNSADFSPAMKCLIDLSKSEDFVLNPRICWQSYMNKGHLMGGTVYSRVASHVHDHMCRGPIKGNAVKAIIERNQIVYDKIGKHVFRQNVALFFEIIDRVWGLKNITFKDAASQLRLGFLCALAFMLSRHTDFWDGDNLKVSKNDIAKLKSFSLLEPTINQLCRGGSGNYKFIMNYLVQHMNKYRKEGNKLEQRESTRNYFGRGKTSDLNAKT